MTTGDVLPAGRMRATTSSANSTFCRVRLDLAGEDQLLTRADDDRQRGIEIRFLLDAHDELVIVDEWSCVSQRVPHAELLAEALDDRADVLQADPRTAILAQVAELDELAPRNKVATGRHLADDRCVLNATSLVAVEPAANLVLAQTEQRRSLTDAIHVTFKSCHGAHAPHDTPGVSQRTRLDGRHLE